MKLCLVVPLSFVLACVVACSGSEGTISNPSPTDPAPPGEGSGNGGSGSSGATGDATDGGIDATPKEAGSGAKAGVGACASCTAGKCGKELQACAGSQTCVDGLVAFNGCFGKQSDGTSGTCGDTFAAAGAQASALWRCDKTSCASECGVP